MSSRKMKIAGVLLAFVLLMCGFAWRFRGTSQEGVEPGTEQAVLYPPLAGGSSPNAMFAAPHTLPGKARSILRDQSLEAALQSFRKCKAPYYDSTLQSEQTIRAMGRDRVREIIPDLMNIMKQNPDCAMGVGNILNMFKHQPPSNQEPGAQEDAATLMPFIQDDDLRVRLVAADGISQMLANEAPPEVLHLTLDGLASGHMDTISSSLGILWNMVSDGSGHPLPLDPSRFGGDIQSVRVALASVAAAASFEQIRATAANLIPWVKDGGLPQ